MPFFLRAKQGLNVFFTINGDRHTSEHYQYGAFYLFHKSCIAWRAPAGYHDPGLSYKQQSAGTPLHPFPLETNRQCKNNEQWIENITGRTDGHKTSQVKLPFVNIPKTPYLSWPCLFLSCFLFNSRSFSTLALTCSLWWKLIELAAFPPLLIPVVLSMGFPLPGVEEEAPEDSWKSPLVEDMLVVALRSRLGTRNWVSVAD